MLGTRIQRAITVNSFPNDNGTERYFSWQLSNYLFQTSLPSDLSFPINDAFTVYVDVFDLRDDQYLETFDVSVGGR